MNELNENPTLPIHGVMGSFIKELEWVDNPKPSSMDIDRVVARAYVPMPHTVGKASIEITHDSYYENYNVRLWCFNCGTIMNDHSCKTIEVAKKTAYKWWNTFVSGFLNCP